MKIVPSLIALLLLAACSTQQKVASYASLWKKYPNQIDALAMKQNYLKALKGEIEMMEEYEKANE